MTPSVRIERNAMLVAKHVVTETRAIFAATCDTCKWQGEWRTDEAEARTDAEAHEVCLPPLRMRE